ncbi:type II secretion system minor pseudopilin GspJ [Reinekea blandensis]|uniref:Type II secretion system protein J n=1 Tax=Reinekea blandensis MED297 TaxID=314283 RepID=A4BDX0_9GAMM|nr:type II secretion system minor pseudopilin GspJ [Reinekea blandensis]EAR09729.1 hypothetical protein MED297_16259 [Reinekea blandensis MED297]
MIRLNSGFTLIELLLSLAIAALISVGTLTLFNTSIGAKDVVEEQSLRFASLNRAIRVIEQDLIQVAPYRSVRDPFGDYEDAVHLDYNGLFLTRAGWAQSPFLAMERSSLQRVHYRLAEPGSEVCPWAEDDAVADEQSGCLVRSYRVHLDDDGYLSWQHQVLMTQVESVEWQFLHLNPTTSEQEFRDEPPTLNPSSGVKETVLQGVQFDISLSDGGTYRRLIQVPSEVVVPEGAGQ